MTLHEKQALFTQNVAYLIGFIYSAGESATFGDAYRSPEQAAIYASQGKGIVDSLHNKRLAIDLNLFDQKGNYVTDKQSYAAYGTYWKSLHPLNRWGGDFIHLVDSNHFEMQDK